MSFFGLTAASSKVKVLGVEIPAPNTDTIAPAIPTELTEGNTTSDSTYIKWRAVADDVLTTGYKIYKDDVLAATVVNNEGKVTNLTEGTYSFKVSAIDAAGNESDKSTAINITIPATTSDPLDSIIASKGQIALDSTYIDLNGANVRTENDVIYLTKWVDRSPNLNHATQSDEDLQMEVLPEFKNILPDGFDDVMMFDQDFALNSNTGGFSLFLCLDHFISGLNVVLHRRGAAGSGAGLYFYKNGSTYELRMVTAANYLLTFGGLTLADTTGNKVFEIHHDGVATAKLLINGVEKSSVTANNDSWVFGRISSAYDGDYFEGFFKGIFAFNTVLSEGEKTTVRNALTSRYNVV
jgi:hypothetical protein